MNIFPAMPSNTEVVHFLLLFHLLDVSLSQGITMGIWQLCFAKQNGKPKFARRKQIYWNYFGLCTGMLLSRDTNCCAYYQIPILQLR